MRSRRTDISESHAAMRSQYSAAKRSRLRRERQIAPMGATGDYHLPGDDYLRVIEFARAVDRDDPVMGSVLDRATINTVQDGFILDVDLQDAKLDSDVISRWAEETTAARLDVAGERSFSQMEAHTFRFSGCDGDMWGLLTDDEKIQWWEAHRLRTPSGREDTVAFGVELDSFRKPINVYVTKEDVGLGWKQLYSQDFHTFPVWDEDGNRRFIQVYHGEKRASLTRGLSVYQKLFDLCGMHDDLQFAALLKTQLQNAIVFVEKFVAGDYGPGNFPLGGRGSEDVSPPASASSGASATATSVDGLQAGTLVTRPNGRQLEAFVNSAPGPQFDTHVKMILTILGINLGMPLVLVLMDAKETNFSGWRGAFDQAKLGFQNNQRNLINRMHNPILLWKIDAWMRRDPIFGRAMAKAMLKASSEGRCWYKWHCPTWPYVNPFEDAQANAFSVANFLEAPSTNFQKRSLDYKPEITRAITDREFAIEQSILAADRLNQKYGSLDKFERVRRTELYTPPEPRQLTMSVTQQLGPDGKPVDNSSPQPGKGSSNG